MITAVNMHLHVSHPGNMNIFPISHTCCIMVAYPHSLERGCVGTVKYSTVQKKNNRKYRIYLKYSTGNRMAMLLECQTNAGHCCSWPGSQEIIHGNVVGKI